MESLSKKLERNKQASRSIFDGSGDLIETIPLETIDVDYEDVDFKQEYKERIQTKDRVCQMMEDEGLYNDTLLEEIDNETLAEHHLRLVVGNPLVLIYFNTHNSQTKSIRSFIASCQRSVVQTGSAQCSS